ncbi:hybrid sensor histidine kinase/response regulator transcription factor [Desertivirga brevis]|uniref:hybrid sensor histidine kinase/response regulator transcription factor n=1 Tax=Desertivirga brevis TaxID=2810310 RepID=UPI001A979FC6|nr:hybrid sensor histidine kinase/response regulator transcription factor [Pedobacter sp. SYSU D00873]
MKGFKRHYFPFLFIALILSNVGLFAQLPNLKFQNISTQEGLPQNTVFGIAEDKYGFVWFGTLDGLCRYDGYQFKIYRFNPADINSVNSNQIDNVIKDTKGNIWVATQAGYELCRYNYEKDNFDRISTKRLPEAFVNSFSRRIYGRMVKYNLGHYILRLEKYTNLVQIDTKTNQKKYYFTNATDPWALRDLNISYLYKGGNNILWLGTFNKGISKANIKAKPFEYYYHDPQDPNSIADNVVTAIGKDSKGNLWVGTYDKGITIIGAKGTRQLSLGKPDKIGLSFNQVRSILCDSRGDVWIGSRKGLLKYDGRSGKTRGFESINRYTHTVFGLIEDKDRNIWIATRREGIFKFIVSRDTLIKYHHKKTLNTRDAKCILQDNSGLIWVGTETGGISVLKPVGDTVKLVNRFLASLSKNNDLIDNHIYSLYEDKDGEIWIGTGGGLQRYSPSSKKFTRYFEGSELEGILIAAITEDSSGRLWISHKKGITRLEKKTGVFRTYSIQDGLQSNDFSEQAVFRNSSEGILYFGSNNGVNYFNPDKVSTDRTLPRTVLTELQILGHPIEINQEVNGRVILRKPLYLTAELQLGYKDKSFSIEFAGLHYANPNGNKYAYKLDGFDKDWTYTDAKRRVATYSNLDPGSYTFQVKSSNSDGIWNEKPVQLSIIIQPPFWASNIAYLFYILLAGGLIYIYHLYSSRFNALQNQVLMKSKEQELEKQKLQFFTNVSHEVKTPLTLILAPLEKLPTLVHDPAAFSEQLRILRSNAERLLRMVNQLLDFRRLETGNTTLDLQQHNLEVLIKQLIISFEPLLKENNKTIRLNSPQNPIVLIYDEDKIEKIFSNLLSNAIKFGASNTIIEVDLQSEIRDATEFVIIAVSNIGREIPESDKEVIFEPFKQGKSSITGGTGLGLAYSRGLVEQHRGSITVSSRSIDSTKEYKELFKTTFTVAIPMNLAATANDEQLREENVQVTQQTYPSDLTTSLFDPGNSNPALINGARPLLLIVDDSPDLRHYLSQHFEPFYDIQEASNGKQGLELAEKNIPDLVISDVMMPEMDGKEFCARIKTNPKTAHVPVILLTAKTPIESEIEGYETGADDYITKPFNLAHLTARVKNLLLSRLHLKEKYRKQISLEPTNDAPVSSDDKLLQNFLKLVEERIADPELNVETICNSIGISRSQLYRKIKTLSGLNVADLIKEIRLKRAKQLLSDRKFNVNEVAFLVGFANADHFRRCFKMEFGLSPSEYQKDQIRQ